MVLILGWGNTHDVLGATEDRTCDRCRNTGPWIIYKSRNKLNVMFVPIARWGTKFAARCAVCPNELELSEPDALQLAQGGTSLNDL